MASAAAAWLFIMSFWAFNLAASAFAVSFWAFNLAASAFALSAWALVASAWACNFCWVASSACACDRACASAEAWSSLALRLSSIRLTAISRASSAVCTVSRDFAISCFLSE